MVDGDTVYGDVRPPESLIADELPVPKKPLHISQKMAAPHLFIKYNCPRCHSEAILDAYEGPPRCFGKPTDPDHFGQWMIAISIEDEIAPG